MPKQRESEYKRCWLSASYIVRARQVATLLILFAVGFISASVVYQIMIENLQQEVSGFKFQVSKLEQEIEFLKAEIGRLEERTDKISGVSNSQNEQGALKTDSDSDSDTKQANATPEEMSKESNDNAEDDVKKSTVVPRKTTPRSAASLGLNQFLLPTRTFKSTASQMFNYTAIDAVIQFGEDEPRKYCYQALNNYRNHKCCSNDAQFLTTLAAATYMYSQVIGVRLIGRKTDQNWRWSLMREANATITKSVQLDPENSKTLTWQALIIATFGELDSIESKVKNGWKCKDILLKAKQLDPNNIMVHYVLGRFNYEVFTISSIARMICNTFFGRAPEATGEETLAELEATDRALRAMQPPRRSKDVLLYLAKTHIAIGENENYVKAAQYLIEANDLPLDIIEAKNAQEGVNELLPQYRKYAPAKS